MPITVAVAGATGRLGGLIVGALIERQADVRALVRPGIAPEKRQRLGDAAIVEVDYGKRHHLEVALEGADVVVSALNGLHEVVVGTQSTLLEAAVAAGVGRFIPSDYAADILALSPGENRNFDLRREFREKHLLRAPIASTSVLVGGFMELLLRGRLLDPKAHAVNYWGTPDQPLDYTTMRDTARITAEAALDPNAPKVLRIAGDTITARGIAQEASEIAGTLFSLNRLGSIDDLEALIARERREHPEAEAETFPRFQQLQYTHNMQSGRGQLLDLDNDRYRLRLTTVRDLLAANAALLRG